MINHKIQLCYAGCSAMFGVDMLAGGVALVIGGAGRGAI